MWLSCLFAIKCEAESVITQRSAAVQDSLKILVAVANLNDAENIASVFERQKPVSLESLQMTAIGSYLYYSGDSAYVAYDERWHQLAMLCIISIGDYPCEKSKRIAALREVKRRAMLDGGDSLRVTEIISKLSGINSNANQ